MGSWPFSKGTWVHYFVPVILVVKNYGQSCASFWIWLCQSWVCDYVCQNILTDHRVITIVINHQ